MNERAFASRRISIAASSSTRACEVKVTGSSVVAQLVHVIHKYFIWAIVDIASSAIEDCWIVSAVKE